MLLEHGQYRPFVLRKKVEHRLLVQFVFLRHLIPWLPVLTIWQLRALPSSFLPNRSMFVAGNLRILFFVLRPVLLRD